MVVLVVGADRLGNIPAKLHQEGVKEIIHWDGRHKSYQNKIIPKKINQIIIFYNFINHNLMLNIKRQAKMCGIPVIYTKRVITQKAS